VLIPRPESELLAELAIDFLADCDAPTLWDLCTGSGAVAVAVAANRTEARVLASDVCPAAAAVARENVAAAGLAERVTVVEADLFDLPAEAPALTGVDCLTANPPYVSEADYAQLAPEVRAEPRGALLAGADGLDVIRPILAGAADVIRPGGLLAMEIGYDQAEAVYDLANADRRYGRIELIRDAGGIERVLCARVQAD
jgi:release factor glutamine methyltransferase